MAAKELCGEPTPNGPCTMPKGHRVGYHRHRVYQNITWTIHTDKGVRVESGEARVPLNYAITRALENHGMIEVYIKRWDDSRDIGKVNDK